MTRTWKLWGIFALVAAQLAVAAGRQASGVQERTPAQPPREEGREKLEAARDRLKANAEEARAFSG